MQIEIFINDIKVDVNEGTQVSETKQINDFFDISDRQTSFTNTFKLPKTELNISVFGGHSIVGVTSIFAYKVHNVTIYRDGLPTIQNGIGYLKDTDDFFNLYVYSENIDLFEAMKDKTLAELNLSSLDHELNISNWLNNIKLTFSVQDNSNKDYVYAIADYGYTEGDVIVVNHQIPSLYVKYIWNKIFQENGFEYKYYGRGGRNDYNPFVTEKWNKFAFTIDEGLPQLENSINPIHKLTIQKDKVSHFVGYIVTNPFTGTEIYARRLDGEVQEYIHFTTVFDPDKIHKVNHNSPLFYKSVIRAREDGFYKINISGEVYNHISESLSMHVEKNNVEIFTVQDSFEDEESTVGWEHKLYLKQGDELSIKFKSTGVEDLEIHYSYDIQVDLWLDNTVNFVNFNTYLSKITQKDFIKDVVNYLGLIFRKKGNTYEFMSMEELLSPLAPYAQYTPPEREIIEDWSDKFDSIEVEMTKVGNYAKSNLFKYKYINPNDDYANATIKLDDQTLPNAATLFERIYSAPDRSSVNIGNRQLRYCDFYEKKLDDDGNLKDVKSRKSSHFFFTVENIQTTVKYKLFGADGNNAITGTFPFMSFDEMDFNFVLPERYTAFANMIAYGKKYLAKMKLTALDIHTLDFFKLKYIKQLGGLFYLNKVKNYTGNRLTSVEIIQVRVIERKGEFSDDFNNDFNI